MALRYTTCAQLRKEKYSECNQDCPWPFPCGGRGKRDEQLSISSKLGLCTCYSASLISSVFQPFPPAIFWPCYLGFCGCDGQLPQRGGIPCCWHTETTQLKRLCDGWELLPWLLPLSRGPEELQKQSGGHHSAEQREVERISCTRYSCLHISLNGFSSSSETFYELVCSWWYLEYGYSLLICWKVDFFVRSKGILPVNARSCQHVW